MVQHIYKGRTNKSLGGCGQIESHQVKLQKKCATTLYLVSYLSYFWHPIFCIISVLIRSCWTSSDLNACLFCVVYKVFAHFFAYHAALSSADLKMKLYLLIGVYELWYLLLYKMFRCRNQRLVLHCSHCKLLNNNTWYLQSGFQGALLVAWTVW